MIREGKVSGVGFYLVNEDVRIQGDPAVMPKKGAETVYSQLWRSFCR